MLLLSSLDWNRQGLRARLYHFTISPAGPQRKKMTHLGSACNCVKITTDIRPPKNTEDTPLMTLSHFKRHSTVYNTIQQKVKKQKKVTQCPYTRSYTAQLASKHSTTMAKLLWERQGANVSKLKSSLRHQSWLLSAALSLGQAEGLTEGRRFCACRLKGWWWFVWG